MNGMGLFKKLADERRWPSLHVGTSDGELVYHVDVARPWLKVKADCPVRALERLIERIEEHEQGTG